ncbi:MAG: ORC1-type DNA replication protein [Thermoplasmata archaeon]|nr:MAG: ORC1-type DNA replication protein [Thermoplasmata archaeon]
MKYIADEMKKPSIFIDEEKLDFDYVPEELPRRESELQRLAKIFTPILKTQVSENVFIHGKVGTGKTAMAKKFGRDMGKFGEDLGKIIESVHVNCRQRKTEASVMLKIIQHFQKSFPDRGFSVDEILDSLRKHLEKRRVHLIVVLDEVDVLLKKSGSDLIYYLTRFDEEDSWVKGSLSLILISQRKVYDLFDSAALSTFKRTNMIECPAYTYEELIDILNQRVELSFKSGSVDPEAIDLIADIASTEGDARLAIELLSNAGKNTDNEGSKIVTPEHVRAAKCDITTIEHKLADLKLHEKMTLLAVARLLAKGGAYRSTGEVEDLYGVICEEYSEKPRAHTQFWGYLKDLTNYGLLKTKRSGEGVIGNTTLISLPDIPAKTLSKKLTTNLDRTAR